MSNCQLAEEPEKGVKASNSKANSKTTVEETTEEPKEKKRRGRAPTPHQDDVIEKILKHRGEWDPPWTRQRRARAPPTQTEIFSTVLDEEFSQIPPEDEEDLNQDLLGGDEPL